MPPVRDPSDVDQGSPSCAEQQVVEDPRFRQSEDVEHLGHSQDHMEIGHGKKLALTGLEPSARAAAPQRGASPCSGRQPDENDLWP